MAYENETYTLEGIRTALRVIDEKRETLFSHVSGTMILVSIQEFHDLLNDIESAICGDLEFEDED